MRIVVPFTPGGGTDILARLIAQKLNESWGQPVVVDNRPGASGTVGTAFVAKAAPDGHTLLVMPAGYAGNPSLYKKLPYDQTRELAPVSLLASGPLTLVVHPSLPGEIGQGTRSRSRALSPGRSTSARPAPAPCPTCPPNCSTR